MSCALLFFFFIKDWLNLLLSRGNSGYLLDVVSHQAFNEREILEE